MTGMKAPPHLVPAWASWLTYSVSLVAGLAGVSFVGEDWPFLDPLWVALAANVCATTVVWWCSLVWDNSSLYDPYWCLAPLALTLWFKAESGGGLTPLTFTDATPLFGRGGVGHASTNQQAVWHVRHALVLLLVWCWAARFHVLVPWEGWRRGLTSEDWRYQQIRGSLPRTSFGGVMKGFGREVLYWLVSLVSLHLTPTLLVFAALAPASVILASPVRKQPSAGWCDALALVVCVSGIALEAWADEVLRRFRSRSQLADPKANKVENKAVTKATTKKTTRPRKSSSSSSSSSDSRDSDDDGSGGSDSSDSDDDGSVSASASGGGGGDGGCCTLGPWAWCRHPNYCGECLFWFGLALFPQPQLQLRPQGVAAFTRPWWRFFGCTLMFAFFRFASAPLMDTRSLHSRARKKRYKALMRQLPCMVPSPHLCIRWFSSQVAARRRGGKTA